jgi:hypothetical protein
VAVVLDGSIGMGSAFADVAAAFPELTGDSELAVFVAREGARRLTSGTTATGLRDTVRGLRAEGGQDNVPALLDAWEWAAEARNSVIIWIHAPQPVLLGAVSLLRQRLERQTGEGVPRLFDFAARPGPNRILEKLAGFQTVQSVPRIGSIRGDLQRVFASWTETRPVLTLVREWISGSSLGELGVGEKGSSHITRLWAASVATQLWQARRQQEAADISAAHHLVTAASGAVVLENPRQFARAGLQPVDPGTVPVVPEPGVVQLIALGLIAGCFSRWARKTSRDSGARATQRGGSCRAAER